MARFLLVLLTALAATTTGCACNPTSCRGTCGACPEPVSFTVSLAVGSAPITVTGDDAISCETIATGETRCTSATIGTGAHTLEVSAPGYVSQTVRFTINPAPAGVCCACPSSFRDEIELAPPGFGDAGPRDGGPRDAALDAPDLDAAEDDAALDGSADDAPLDDAPLDDAPLDDAPRTDAGACDPSAVRFTPAGGTLEPGQLCDDVFVCLATEAEGAAVMAASSRFVCSSVPEGPCPASTCRYADPGGPSTLDQSEIDEICAVTIALPAPDLVCMIYL